MASPLPSPGPYSPSPGPPSNVPDVSEREMKLKVLYTFDNDNKTNCLARWPHVISVKTVTIDQAAIGVVELKTCIQAIVSASPEILAKLGQDYTVYAYDYSEYETPLVGQGMLSSALASASGPNIAPAHQSTQLITGRVSWNKLGILQGGVQETLEVKLRLVPVPTCLQGEYLNSLEKSREAASYDPAAWKRAVDPGTMALANQLTPTVSTPYPTQAAGMEMLGMLMAQSGNDVSVHSAASSPRYDDTFEYSSASPAPGSIELQQITHGIQPRPLSRASIGDRRQSITRPLSAASGLDENAMGDDGPVKKRARVTKANWNGRSNLPAPESLRVAASTAASMRIQRPVALAPDRGSLEDPPRAPTPRPEFQGPPSTRSRPLGRSSLRAGSFSQSGYQSFEDDSVSSPEDVISNPASPYDLPSSPPVLSMTEPSSPTLPQISTNPHNDSGFMSGTLEELLDPELSLKPHNPRGVEINRARPSSRPPSRRPSISRPQSRSGKPESNDRRSGILKLPPVAASDPVQPRPSSLNRSQTWGGSEAAHPMSDAPTGTASFIPRSGSGAARKRAIQEKLLSAISSGEMPTYCDNCGAIETPTWRKAWKKELQGTLENLGLATPEAQKAFLQIEAIEYDGDGNAIAFRVTKKSVAQDDEDYKEVTLCNSCGLWLSKFKSMRPPEKWVKQKKDPSEKRKRRGSKKKGAPDAATSPAATPAAADQDASTPSEAADDGDVADEGGEEDAQEVHEDNEPAANSQEQNMSQQRRANSADLPSLRPPGSALSEATAQAALQRAIQSSPARLTGAAVNIPIDMNKMGSTRRLLFPSPRKEAEPKALSSIDSNVQRRGNVSAQSGDDNSNNDGKKNQAKASAEEEVDEFAHLFEMDELDEQTPDNVRMTPRRSPRNHKGPQTPARQMRSKTPTPSRTNLSGLSFFSSAAKAELMAMGRSPSQLRSTRRTRSACKKGMVEEEEEGRGDDENSHRPLSPFSVHLNKLLDSEGPGSPSAGGAAMGFDDLIMSPSQLFGMGVADPFSTDAIMPSSPPFRF